jgi:CTD small phosphatase-like protein 2
MAGIYEVVIFTASHSCYANVVVDYLDPKKEWVTHRLYRETCIQSDAGVTEIFKPNF